jgi:prepilin-type N-terminal cleavage/methylation domain-containing protein
MTKQRGFTLIEMAMVVAIIGLIVGGGVIAITPITLQAKTNQTNTALDQIEAALVLFAIRNNRLPCPADGSLANTNSNYGMEVTQTAAGTCDLTGTSSTKAVVPWRTLGLDETYSVDGWGNRISYFPANPMLGATTNTLVDNTTSPSVRNCLSRISSTTAPTQGFRSSNCDASNTIGSGSYGTYGLPTYPFGNYIAVYSLSSGACSTELTQPNTNGTATAYSGTDSCTSVAPAQGITSLNVMFEGQRAAYVVISHGPSGWYGWTRGGTQILPSSSGTTYTSKLYNSGFIANLAGSGANVGFVQGAPQVTNDRSNPNYFDDIVRWRSPAFIIQQCGSGSCGNP